MDETHTADTGLYLAKCHFSPITDVTSETLEGTCFRMTEWDLLWDLSTLTLGSMILGSPF